MHYRLHIGILLCVVCVVAPSRAYGSGSLQLTVSTNVESLAVFEPVLLTVVLENLGDEVLKFRTDLFREESAGAVILRSPNGTTTVFRRPEYRGAADCKPGHWHPLPPGSRYECSFLLAANYDSSDDPVFSKPGRYALTVEYDDADLKAKSDPLVIEVFDLPESDREALKRVNNLSFLPALYEPDMIYAIDGVDREKLLQELKTLAEDKESEIYANYARYGLAWVQYMIALEEYSSTYQAGDAFTPENTALFRSCIDEAGQFLAAVNSEKLTIQPRIAELRRAIVELKKNWETQGNPSIETDPMREE